MEPIRVPQSKSFCGKTLTWWWGLLLLTIGFSALFLSMATVYDMGVKQGQIGALKTAYEVCRKVAPYKDGEGCK
jgi:hypothetical protein